VFLAGLGWFTLASVLCAAAPGIGWLIAARAVQGIGGALMTPASLGIIEAAFRPGDRTRAIGTWAGFSGVSAAIAPFLGGWLLEADSLAGLASGVNNAVARVAGLLWIAALPPITGLTGAAYTDPVQFRSSFAQISWICAAAFGCATVLAATFITGPGRPTQRRRPALIQTPVPHLACPVAFRHAPRRSARSDT
jgi:MFS family permease